MASSPRSHVSSVVAFVDLARARFRRPKSIVIASALAAACCAMGCTEPVQTIVANGTIASREFVVPVESDFSAGARELASVTGPVVDLTYTLDTSRRLYLIRGDLTARLDPHFGPIEYLVFPRGADVLTERTVLTGTDQAWLSLREYDLGRCSLFVPWRQLQDRNINPLVRAAFSADPNFADPVRIGGAEGDVMNVGPILVRTGPYDSSDEMRYNFWVSSPSVAGCAPFVCDVESRWDAREVAAAPVIDSCSGVPRAMPSGLIDLALVPASLQAEVRDFCIAEGDPIRIEDQITASLRTALPTNFVALIDSVSRFPAPSVLPTGIFSCACDSDCDGNPLLGPRARCIAGTCEMRTELERIFLMPEGFVVVYAEDDADPQIGVLTSAVFEAAVYNALAPGVSPDFVRDIFGVDYSCGTEHLPIRASSETAPLASEVLAVFDAPSL